MKKILVKVICYMVYWSGVLFILRILNNYRNEKTSAYPIVDDRGSSLSKKIFHKGIPILIYHRVNDCNDPFFPAVSTSTFERQIKYLSARYKIVSLHEVVRRLKSNNFSENVLAITFDDGYRDNYLNAYPILKKYSSPATIFLATGLIGNGNFLWLDKISYALKMTTKRKLIINGITYQLNNKFEKVQTLFLLYKYLIKVAETRKNTIIKQIEEQLEISNYDELSNLMLSWDDIRIMSKNNVSFGAHTINHPILSRIPLDEARKEIVQSKIDIEKKIGTCVDLFAYPNGKYEDFNKDIIKIVQDAGFICACSTFDETNYNDASLYSLNRMPLAPNLPEFATKFELNR